VLFGIDVPVYSTYPPVAYTAPRCIPAARSQESFLRSYDTCYYRKPRVVISSRVFHVYYNITEPPTTSSYYRFPCERNHTLVRWSGWVRYTHEAIIMKAYNTAPMAKFNHDLWYLMALFLARITVSVHRYTIIVSFSSDWFAYIL